MVITYITCCNTEFKILHTHTHNTYIRMYLHSRIERTHIVVFPWRQGLPEHATMGSCMCRVCRVIVIGIDVAINNIKVFSVTMEM
jgi:hypothetical protein